MLATAENIKNNNLGAGLWVHAFGGDTTSFFLHDDNGGVENSTWAPKWSHTEENSRGLASAGSGSHELIMENMYIT
jgi:hypothetical protein